MPDRPTDEELLDELRAVAEILGRPPTAREMRKHPEWSDRVYEGRFGTWNSALKKAKLPINQPSPECSRVTKEEILEDVRRVAREIEGIPSTTDYEAHGGFKWSIYMNHFDEWADVLIEAGLLESDAT